MKMDITYEDISAAFRKGLRNGNWRMLNYLGKALFRVELRFGTRNTVGG